MKPVHFGKLTASARLKIRLLVVGLSWILCMSTTTFAQFKAVSDLGQAGEGGVLIGGVIADTAQWPATFYATTSAGNCTSSVIGPQVVLLAAHCLPAGRAITIQSTFGSRTGSPRVIESNRCAIHPKWSETSNQAPDFAVCYMKDIVPLTKYETLALTVPSLRIGHKVWLSGFGCMGVGPDDKPIYDYKFRVGEAKIEQLPFGPDYDGFLVTRGDMTAGGAALCYGDSGGAAYTDASEGRKILAVNARANIKDTSYLSPVWATDARSFIGDFLVAVGAQACGVNEGVGLRSSCR